jgi:serine protease AprX
MRKLQAALVAAAVLGALAPLAANAARAPGAARVQPALADRLAAAPSSEKLVVLVHGTSRDLAVDAVARAGLEQLLVLESIGVPAAAGTVAQVRDLLDEPGITYLEQDAPLALYSDTAVEATRTAEAQQTFVDTDGSPLYTGAGRSIAIVDGGVDGSHPMFRRPDGTSKVVRNMKVACVSGVVWFNHFPPTDPNADRFPPDLCPTGEGSDQFMVDVPTNDSDTISGGGHGTHVASIAAGVPTQYGDRTLTGTAPGADLVAISTGYSLSVLTADVALDWIARNHANPCATAGGTCNPITVVNNSYGPNGGGEFDPESATVEIQRRLVEANVVMVWANGNGDNTDTSAQPGGTGTDNRSNPPAQDPTPGVLGVANYDDGGTGTRDGSLNPSSSRGLATDATTWPDVSAPGTNITAACRPYLTICNSAESDPNFGTISGTSMATPHVVGIVALLQEAEPGITPAEIERTLENTAYRFSAGAPYGPDPRNPDSPSSFDKGHGLVDTVAALTATTTDVVDHGEPPVTAAACTPGQPVVTDAEGDATQVALLTALSAPDEPGLDVRRLDVSWDDAANVVHFTIKVSDLGDANPDTAPNASWNSTFSIDGTGYYVEAIRSASGDLSFGYGDSATVDAGVTGATVRAPEGSTTGVLDPATDTITIDLPSTALEGLGAAPLAAGTVLRDFVIVGRRTATDRAVGQGPAADQSDAAGCPYTLGHGTGDVEAPPPPPPTGDTFYLHLTGECADGASTPGLDRVNSAGDLDGCGSIGTGGLAGDDVQTWPATESVGAVVPAGTTVNGTVYLETDAPALTSCRVTLSGSGGEIGSAITDVDVTLGAVEQVIGSWFPCTFELTTTRDVDADEMLAFAVGFDTTSTVSWYFGYEGDHASSFTIG